MTEAETNQQKRQESKQNRYTRMKRDYVTGQVLQPQELVSMKKKRVIDNRVRRNYTTGKIVR